MTRMAILPRFATKILVNANVVTFQSGGCMARLDLMPAHVKDHLLAFPCAPFDTSPWVKGPPLNERKVALISTAGLQRRGDRPFGVGAADYRLIASDTLPADLVMSHISTNFDRTGFQQDWNVVFPLERQRS